MKSNVLLVAVCALLAAVAVYAFVLKGAKTGAEAAETAVIVLFAVVACMLAVRHVRAEKRIAALEQRLGTGDGAPRALSGENASGGSAD